MINNFICKKDFRCMYLTCPLSKSILFFTESDWKAVESSVSNSI